MATESKAQTTAEILKMEGINQTASHSPDTLEQVLRELEIVRRCRLRTKLHDEVFTIESLIESIRPLCRLPIPHSLNGAVGHYGRRRKIFEGTGRLVVADRNERRANKIEECRWALY